MKVNNAIVTACATNVLSGRNGMAKAIMSLYNEVGESERRATYYAIVGALIEWRIPPAVIVHFRDMVSGCANDIGVEDLNVQRHWNETDHVNANDVAGIKCGHITERNVGNSIVFRPPSTSVDWEAIVNQSLR